MITSMSQQFNVNSSFLVLHSGLDGFPAAAVVFSFYLQQQFPLMLKSQGRVFATCYSLTEIPHKTAVQKETRDKKKKKFA